MRGRGSQLFFIDIMLPDMVGIALGKRLEHTRFAETPKIAMSASGEVLTRAKQSGTFHGLLDKPFDVGDVLEYVEHYVQR